MSGAVSVQFLFIHIDEALRVFSSLFSSCRYLHISGPDSGSSGARRGSAPVVNASALPGHVSGDRRGSEPSLFSVLGVNNWERRGSEPLVTNLSSQQTSQHPTTDIVEEEEHTVLETGSILHPQGKLDLICNLYAQYVLHSLAVPGCEFGAVAKDDLFVLQRRGCSYREVRGRVPIIYPATVQVNLQLVLHLMFKQKLILKRNIRCVTFVF